MIVQEITPRDSGAASDGGRWIPSTRCLVRVILGIARRVATCLVLNAVRINLTYRRQVRRHGPQAAGRGPEDGGAARGALPQSPAGDGDRRAVRRGGVLRHPRSGAGQVRDGAGGPRGRRSRHASGGRVRVLPAVVLRHGGRAGGRRAALALASAKPGPKKAHKLTAQVCAFCEQQLAADPALRPKDLSGPIEAAFSVRVHPRSIERALARYRIQHSKSGSRKTRNKACTASKLIAWRLTWGSQDQLTPLGSTR